MKKINLFSKFYASHLNIFFFCCLVFSICVNFNFFIKKQFFSDSGSINLLLFFSIIPYLCILIVPALSYKTNISIYDDFIPEKRFLKILKHFFYLLVLFIFILLTIFPSILFINSCGNVDFATVASSYFSLILYGASVISLCIFINQIFHSNVLSFLISAIILAIFNSIHLLTLYLPLPDFLTAFGKKLSFAWHFNSASKGIVDSRDLIWFSVLTIFFLFSAYLLDEKKRGKVFKEKKSFNKFSIIFIYAILALSLLNSEKYYKNFDLSKGKVYSLSDYSKSLLQKVDESIKVTYYRSLELEKLYPQVRDIQDYLISYLSQNKNFNLIIKDPHKANALGILESYGIPSQQIKTIKNNSTQFLNVYSAIIIESGNKIQTIPFILDLEFLEYNLSCKIKNILSDELREVNIVIGNGMDFNNDYNFLIPFLNAQNFLCNPLYPQDPNFPKYLELCQGPLYVIGDSQTNIDAAIAIENYILTGKGNGFFNISPFSSKIEEDWRLTPNSKTNIVEMLENWGLVFTNNICADLSCSRITMYSQEEASNDFVSPSTYTKVLNYPFWINILPQENTVKGCTLFWPTELKLSENASPYLYSSDFGYHYMVDLNSPDKILETNPFYLEMNPNGETYKHVLAAQISGELQGLYNVASIKDARIIVIPDQYFVNSLMTGYIGGEYGDYRNFDLVSDILLRLNGEEELANLYNKGKVDSSLFKISSQESAELIKKQTLSFLFIVYPILIILIWVAFLIYRKIQLKKTVSEIINYENKKTKS